MFPCPRCGDVMKTKNEAYEHFSNDIMCPPKISKLTYPQIVANYPKYCEDFEEEIARKNGYLREGYPIKTTMEMVNNIKMFLVIQKHDHIPNDLLLWALDIAFSKSSRKIHRNYERVIKEIVKDDCPFDPPEITQY